MRSPAFRYIPAGAPGDAAAIGRRIGVLRFRNEGKITNYELRSTIYKLHVLVHDAILITEVFEG